MILPTATVDIAAPRHRVFSFMANPDYVKRWQPDVVESTPLTDGGMRRGARWRVTVQEYGRRFDVETSVVDMALDQRLVFETSAPTANVQVEYRFFDYGLNTRVEPAGRLPRPRRASRRTGGSRTCGAVLRARGVGSCARQHALFGHSRRQVVDISRPVVVQRPRVRNRHLESASLRSSSHDGRLR